MALTTRTTSPKPLTRMDKKILARLQDNGRISYVDLATDIGLSTSACIERVRRLEKNGYIKGYTAILDPVLLEAPILVYVEVTLMRMETDAFERFGSAVLDVPEILECHMVSGNFDYLLKIRIRNMPSYRELLGRILKNLPGIRDTNSYVVMDEIKETSNVHVTV